MDEMKQSKLAEVFKLHKVAVGYLYGSSSRDDMGPLSDIDVAVLFAEKAEGPEVELERYSRLKEAVQKNFEQKVDLVDLTGIDNPLLLHRAVTRGKRLYCGDDRARQQLERRALQEYEDTRHLRAIQDEALMRHLKAGTYGKPFKNEI